MLTIKVDVESKVVLIEIIIFLKSLTRSITFDGFYTVTFNIRLFEDVVKEKD